MRAVIIFFAKAPDPGNVKTRLVPPLTPAEAAELHIAFVVDMITRFQKLARFDIELHTDVSTDAWAGLGVTRKVQISGCLGLKMFHGLTDALARGYERAAIIGTDAPTLPSEHVVSLVCASSSVTLGPADDGGFWGIAADETKPNMFDGVQWSCADTCEQTIASVDAAGLSVGLGDNWYDVDDAEDLERLLATAVLPPATDRWVRQYAAAIEARKATP